MALIMVLTVYENDMINLYIRQLNCFLHFQSSVVSIYIMFLTWSAMTSSTKVGCNPQLSEILTGHENHSQEQDQSGASLDSASIVGIVVWVCLVMYSSVSTAGKVGVSAAPEVTPTFFFLLSIKFQYLFGSWLGEVLSQWH